MKIVAVGGYDEIGKNMTCLVVGNEALVLDMGLHIENLMGRDFHLQSMTRKELRVIEVVPDERVIEDVRHQVVGIVIGHGHLDHIGAVSKLAHAYDCPIFLTPFSAQILKNHCRQEEVYTDFLDIREVLPGATVHIGDGFDVEFIPTAHSIPDATIPAIHTREGTVIYANDYKFDHDIAGRETNTERLGELGKTGVKALIFDTTRVKRPGHTGTEAHALEKIRKALSECNPEGGIIATTFASHIARHQNLILAAGEIGRRVVFLGRSMDNYLSAAKMLGILDMRGSRVFGRRRGIMNALGKADKTKVVFVVTGNQGEPHSVLDRISRAELPFEFKDRNDSVLFCCEVIPTETNQKYRKELEERLESEGVEHIFRDLHVSGHAQREDVRKMLQLTRPEHVIPTHGGRERLESAKELALEEGFLEKNIHLLHDGESLEI